MKQNDIVILFYILILASFWKIEMMFIYAEFCKGVKDQTFGMILMFLVMALTFKILTDLLFKITRRLH